MHHRIILVSVGTLKPGADVPLRAYLAGLARAGKATSLIVAVEEAR